MLLEKLLDGADLVLFWEEEAEMWEVAEVRSDYGRRLSHLLETNTSSIDISRTEHLGHSPRFQGAWCLPNPEYDPEDSAGFALFHFRFYNLKVI